MADIKKKVNTNVAGDFFVDTTCINCNACRHIAPKTFNEVGDYSSVYKQPSDKEDYITAVKALISCPIGSIGYQGNQVIELVGMPYPELIEDDVYFLGMTSRKSFGGKSYLIKRLEGNWMIDSPKFSPKLVKKIKAMGGIKFIFLTHKDDVADAEKYAQEFKSTRIIHIEDANAQRNAELKLKDVDDQIFEYKGVTMDDFRIIHVPGHTKGHMALLYKEKFLFSGDHMWWNAVTKSMYASEEHCWYNFDEQLRSIEKLLNHNFEWLLSAHGYNVKKEPEEMKEVIKYMLEKLAVSH